MCSLIYRDILICENSTALFSIPRSDLLYTRTGIFNKFDMKNSIGRIGTYYCTAKLEIFNSIVTCYILLIWIKKKWYSCGDN